jgi:heavy metal efflux system protein
MAGIPGLETTRSISRNGFSQVTIVFTEKTDLYFLRQQVAERLTAARESLPAGVEPSMGPISSGLGEVLMWTVEYGHPTGRGAVRKDGAPGWQSDGAYLTPAGERLSDAQGQAAYLHEVQDWIVDPQMRAVPGVAGIDSIGGYEKEYVVEPDPAKMSAYGVSFADLGEALEKANVAVGANFLERGGEAYLVRADARLSRIDQIEDAVIAARAASGVRVSDVAKVRVGGMPRQGAASENGEEVVVGTALMRIGENSRAVAKASAERIGQIGAALPADIKVKVVYDRSNLVNAAIRTWPRARCWWWWCSSCCWATSAPP